MTPDRHSRIEIPQRSSAVLSFVQSTGGVGNETALVLATPTLLVGGDVSPQIFPLMLNGLQPCLARVERITITKASHGVYQDNPADFNREVLGFLKRQ
jgi:pimeloyl-ACP methyl ester carboxylesterase